MKRTKVKFISTVAILVFLALVVFIFLQQNGSDKSNSSNSESDNAIEGGLIIGDPNAKATLVEFADYKCPLCNRFHQTTFKELEAKYISSGKLKISAHPLPFIGPDSGTAAEGAFCANDQGKFAKYNDRVLNYMWDTYYKTNNFQVEGEQILTRSKLIDLGKEVGIEEIKFAECLNTSSHINSVQTELNTAKNNGVSGTPTFFIGGQKVVGAQPFAVFEPLIEAQLK